MLRIILVVLSSFMVFSSPIIQGAPGKVTGGINFEIPDWFKTSFLEIAEDVEEASEENKHLMLFMHLNGCPYCNKMIAENFADNALKPYLVKHFDSIALNIQGDREIEFNEQITTTERNLSQWLKVKYTPTIIFLNADNKSVLRLNGYRSPETLKQALEYVHSKAYLKTSFNEYKNNQPKATHFKLSDSPLYSKVSDFSRLTKPLAIMFEDKNCDECSKFQKQIMARPEIQKQLKRYTFVRLDALSNEILIDFEGNKISPKQWAEKLALSYRPGIILFDNKNEVARVESMLYPFHFENVLLFGLDENHKKYANYLDLMMIRTQQLLDKGIDVNIGKMAF